jgi:tRNA (pseudouridine54-N1)-methyltransferase
MEGCFLNLSIVVDALRARTSDEFLIRDLPGTSGRLDVVCRILVSIYRTNPKLADAIQVNAVLGGPPTPPLRINVHYGNATDFPESELECAIILKDVLHHYRTKGVGQDCQWPQFSICSQSFSETLQSVIGDKKQILYLVESGTPLQEAKLDLNQPLVLILGDDQGLSEEHEKHVYSHPVQKVSIGTRSLLGSHVISLVLRELMRRNESK